MRLLALLSSLALLCGCNSGSGETPEKQPAPTAESQQPINPWLLTARDPSNPEPALLWNGLVGIRIARDGTGSSPAGDLPFFAIEEYGTEGEEKIVQLPNPLCMKVTAAGQLLDPTKGTGYEQVIDTASGVMTTRWEQPVADAKLKVEVRTVVHPELRMLGDQWTFTADKPLTVEGTCTLPNAAPSKSVAGATELTFEWPPRDMKGTAHLRSSGGPTDQGQPSHVTVTGKDIVFLGGVDQGRPASLERVYSFGLSPTKIDILSLRGLGVRMAEGWDRPEPPLKFAELTGQSAKIWQERWKTDIEIDGPKEDQLAIRSFLFYLRSSIHPESIMSVSPMGLSSTTYNGHVFWDADLWVFPALAFVDPGKAAQIVHYRQGLLQAARDNYDRWIAEGRPTGAAKLGPLPAEDQGETGTKYPWESSVSGKETVPGPSKFEDHITGTVAFSQVMAARLGLLGIEQADEVVQGAATFYQARSQPGEGAERIIRGTMSPDEHHIGDNDLYTNLLAQWVTNGGKWSPSGTQFKLPRDDQTFLTYDNDPVKGYKQAAAVLAIFPLQFPPAEKEARQMMERFEDKVTENGPAMSDSIHATIWARLGEKEKAYKTWHDSWKPFTNNPLMLFSEKRSKPVTYFTTGAAGSMSAVIYGFLGFRLDSEQEPGAAWSKQLNGEAWLSIKPNLPPAWKSVKFKNFQLLGQSYTLTVTPTATTVAQGE